MTLRIATKFFCHREWSSVKFYGRPVQNTYLVINASKQSVMPTNCSIYRKEIWNTILISNSLLFVTKWECFEANRPFARWRHFTTTTRILFGFLFIFKFGNPCEVLNNKSPNLHKKAKPWRILVMVVKWRHHANGPFCNFVDLIIMQGACMTKQW